jgi:hypothetical protein
MANDAINDVPSFQNTERQTPKQIFSNTRVYVNPKHWKPFGCPVYVLDSALQTGNIFHKWKQRSKVGIYIGRSPQHGRNVALVLDRTTGLVSPQFHVKFDPSFQSVQKDEYDSIWQSKAGFVTRLPQEKSAKQPARQVIRPELQQVALKKRRSKYDKDVRSSEGVTKRARLSTSRTNPNLGPSNKPDGNTAVTVSTSKDASSNPGGTVSERTESLEVPAQRGESEAGSPSDEPSIDPSMRTSSGRRSHPVQRLIEAMTAEILTSTKDDIQGEIFCYQALFPFDDQEVIEAEQSILACKATSDPDTMYLHEAMKEPDKADFLKAMMKEVEDQVGNGNFSIIPKSSVKNKKKILPAVWQMKRKRDIRTRKVKKWKARLNIDGSRMRSGIDYQQTYAPVASRNSIQMLLTLAAVHGWKSTQLDYVLAFPQAPVEGELYMKIPKGFELSDGNSDDYVLQLHRNIYGQKQAGRVWNQYLVNKLVNELKFKQSEIDECVFYRGKTLYVLYTDDSLLAGPDQNEIDQIIKDLKAADLNITVEGDIQDFLGINIDRKSDGTVHLTQPHLIEQILKDLNLDKPNTVPKETPASSSKLLARHLDSEQFDKSFDYRSVIGKLNYLEKATRSDISYITHQCARFAANPRVEHGRAVRWLGRYLYATKDKGTILKPVSEKDLEVFVDADFSGNWDPKDADWDTDTARSRHGYIITYAGCPIVWKSQLQTEIALSTTESEYTGLSYALRSAIPIMQQLDEMQNFGFPIRTAKTKVHCKVFEDNSGALEIAKVHKYRPRTKHLNTKLHHFRDYVNRSIISIHKIDTSMQLADYLTKPVSKEILMKLRPIVMGW